MFGLLTTARDWTEPETDPDRQNTTRWQRFGLYCGLGLTVAAPALAVCYILYAPSLLRNIPPPPMEVVMVQCSSRSIDLGGLLKTLFTVFFLQWILENLEICPELTSAEILCICVIEIVWRIVFTFWPWALWELRPGFRIQVRTRCGSVWEVGFRYWVTV